LTFQRKYVRVCFGLSWLILVFLNALAK